VHVWGDGGMEVVVVVLVGSHIIIVIISVVQMLGLSSIGGSELQGPGVLLSVAGIGILVIITGAGIVAFWGLQEGVGIDQWCNF